MGLEKKVNNAFRKARECMKSLAYSAIFLTGVSGCSVNLPGPGGRLGCVPIPSPITVYLGENAAETQRGIAYTCKAGHVDIAHVRKYAEWTEHIAKKSAENLIQTKSEFSFKGSEPGRYYVMINYPKNWQDSNENKKQQIIEEVSIQLGQYVAHTMSIWHEILTWFGWTYIGIPEFNSSFSWEDRFSDTLGCYLGAKALRQGGLFNREFNLLLKNEFERLDIQPKNNSEKATKNVEGKWYTGEGFSGGMLVRNFDIGLVDGKVDPIIPPIEDCEDVRPWACPVPDIKTIKEYEFLADIKIVPGCKAGEKAMLIARKQGRVNPEEDFPKIMEYIRKDAINKGYKGIY